MDNKQRFDQLESLLVDLARKVDQQSGQIAQIVEVLNRQGEAIHQQGEAINRQSEAINRQGEIMEQRFGDIGEQIGAIINILKISEARHTETMSEIRRLGARTDASIEAIKLLVKRQETTENRVDGLVQTQLQMLQLQRLDAEQLAELNRKFPTVEGQEPRIKRLEDEVFRAAS